MSTYSLQAPYVGMRFRHKRILDNSNPRQGADCVVSSIRHGAIYYRVAGETKAKEYTTMDRWSKIYGGLVA